MKVLSGKTTVVVAMIALARLAVAQPQRGFEPPQFPLFATLDTDGDGEISADEIGNASAALKQLDKNGDGKLIAEELRPERVIGGRWGGDFVDRIKRFDRNDDGRVDNDELPGFLSKRLLDRWDANNDNAIDESELKQMMGGGQSEEPLDDGDQQEDAGEEEATHLEVSPLPIKFGSLKSLRLRADGNLLAADSEDNVIKVISPAGDLLNMIDPGFCPTAIAVGADGTIYCGGEGQIAELDVEGAVIRTAKLPEHAESDVPRRRAGSHPPGISGLAVSDEFVFVTFGSGWSVGAKAKLFRFDSDLENPQLLAEGLRGCCQHCDIQCHEGVLYMAENSAYRVVLYDSRGAVLDKWGSKSRDDPKLFGGCCNPMNIAFDSGGILYTAESGLGRVKRYTPNGEFLGLVGNLDVERFDRGGRVASSCCHIPIAVTPDAKRVYVTDVKENIIRVLQQKGT